MVGALKGMSFAKEKAEKCFLVKEGVRKSRNNVIGKFAFAAILRRGTCRITTTRHVPQPRPLGISSWLMVLATTKDYSHRIYLGQGIYGEVTLRYRNGGFHPWEWTYPDYASPRYLEIFAQIRGIYVAQLRDVSAR